MCTALDYQGKYHYFGRNLDYHRTFGEELVVTPRNFPLVSRTMETKHRHLAFFGVATVTEDYPLYFDGANEKGLCIAGLNFVGNATYSAPMPERINLPPYELIPYLLGNCGSVKEARELLSRVNLAEIPFREDLPLAQLHWMISDRTESLVLETDEGGTHLYENPIGVLTNNPPFPYHRDHLREYLHLSPKPPENRFAPNLDLHPFSKGQGAFGLPGDLSSPSRFVRAAFGRWNATQYEEDEADLSQFFHILDFTAQIDGCTQETDGRERTQYSSCYETDRGIGYFKTYENSRLLGLCLFHENLEGSTLSRYPLYISSEIRWLNGKPDTVSPTGSNHSF